MNQANFFPPSMKGWASLTSFASVAMIPVKDHIDLVIERVWVISAIAVIDLLYYLAFNKFFVTGGNLSLVIHSNSTSEGNEEGESKQSPKDDEIEEPKIEVVRIYIMLVFVVALFFVYCCQCVRLGKRRTWASYCEHLSYRLAA